MRIMEKLCFFHFKPKGGGFGGINRFDPHNFGHIFFRGYLLAPKDPFQNSEIYIFSEIV